MRIRRGLAVCGFLTGALGSQAAGAGETLTRLPLGEAGVPVHQEDWYAVSMLSVRIAWMRYAVERVASADAPGAAVVRVTQESHMDATYNGVTKTSVEVKVLEFEACPPYALIAGRVSEERGDGLQSLVLTATESGMKAVRTDSAGTRGADLGALDFTLEDVLTLRAWCGAGRVTGDVLTCRTLDTLNLVVAPRRVTVLDVGPLDPATDVARWVDVRTEDASDGSTSTIRHDVASGRGCFIVQGALSARLTTESEARKATPRGDLLDVLAVARVDTPLGKPSELAGLVLEAQGPGAERIPNGPGQAIVLESSTGSVVITLGRGSETVRPATAAEIAEALVPTARYGAALPEVGRLVTQALADAKTPSEKVRSLVEFVAKFVEYDIQLGDRPIDEILRTKRGDCSEKAILFVALARAAGIPAREVEGVAYLGDEALAFAGHGWNEVVLDGRWVPVDATTGQVPADIARIALARGVPASGCIPRLDVASFRVRERRVAK